ncbi:unnamed protein product [Phytophthora lilii]|uniref:Unnamed protein product n=1 Tax=Phytophthora lilii TaxID=2077276 RepID=A0A9W6XJZ1_9STRA|nr:unnamed protein product [Phytophthora lilii]
MRTAEEQARAIHAGAENSTPVPTSPSTFTRKKFAVAHENSGVADPVLDLVNHPDTDMFTTNESDQSSLVPVFARRSFVDDICFGGTTFDNCLNTLDKLLARFEECRISVSFTKSIFVQSRMDFLSRATEYERTLRNSRQSRSFRFPRPRRNAVLPWGTELLQQIHPELCSLRCRSLSAQR